MTMLEEQADLDKYAAESFAKMYAAVPFTIDYDAHKGRIFLANIELLTLTNKIV